MGECCQYKLKSLCKSSIFKIFKELSDMENLGLYGPYSLNSLLRELWGLSIFSFSENFPVCKFWPYYLVGNLYMFF